MLTSFLTIESIEKNENALGWALREKVDYIVYDPITHKRGDLDVPPRRDSSWRSWNSPQIFTTFTFLRGKTRLNNEK